jgi:hypothetical protein
VLELTEREANEDEVEVMEVKVEVGEP